MNIKIIQDIQWIITPVSTHFSFIQHIYPSNQIYQKLKINQRVEWEKETMTPNFNVENLRRDKENHGSTIDKKKRQLWRTKTKYKVLYLTQAYQSFSDHLTSTFHFQLLTFFFWSTLGVHTKLDLDLFLNSHMTKLGFYQTQID